MLKSEVLCQKPPKFDCFDHYIGKCWNWLVFGIKLHFLAYKPKKLIKYHHIFMIWENFWAKNFGPLGLNKGWEGSTPAPCHGRIWMTGDFNHLWYGVLHHGSRFFGLDFCSKKPFAPGVKTTPFFTCKFLGQFAVQGIFFSPPLLVKNSRNSPRNIGATK